MVKRTTTKPAAKAVEVVEPLVLVGEPGLVQGRLSLRNPGKTRKVLRGVTLTEKRTRARKGQPAPATPALAAELPRVTVRPNTRKDVDVSVALSRNAAPGIYAMSLALDGEEHAVQVVVTEVVDLEVRPDEIFLIGKPGTKFDKLVVFQNHGNVAVTVPKVGAVQLDLDLLHCRAQRAALDALEGTDRTLDDVTAAMSVSYKAELDSFAPLRVTNDSITVEPGATATQTWTLQIPDKIPVGVAATAAIQIVNETITVRVQAT